MQEVMRVLQGKRQRQLQRKKIDKITPQELFNNFNYHNSDTRPHKILKHQFQHLKNHSYNDIDHLTDRRIYPLSYVFAYEPLRSNQMDEEQKRSRSISDRHQFLRDYDPVKYQQMKQDFLNKAKMQQKMEEELREGIPDSRENDFSSDMTSDLVPFRGTRYSRLSQASRVSRVVKRSRLSNKFRAAAIAIYFIVVTKKRLRKFIQRRKEKCLQSGKMYIQQASFTMQTYYFNILEQQITQYILLLQKVYRYPSYNSDSDILRILTNLTSKLNNSTVPKSLLECLELLAVNYTFFNFPFLFYSEAVRLQMSEEYGCIINIGETESLMISGCLMGIVMLCFNLLYRPWLASNLFMKKEKRQFNIENHFERLKKTIHKLASIVYFLIIDHFIDVIDEIQCTHHQFEAILKKCGIDFVTGMKVEPKYFKEEEVEDNKDSQNQETQELSQATVKTKETTRFNVHTKDKTGIINDQNRNFYMSMQQKFPVELEIISENLSQWITKTTLAALRECNSARKERATKFVGKIKRSPY